MDYAEWSREYLREAADLKERIVPLKQTLKSADRESLPLLYRRIAILEEMYFECLHTGRCLAQRAQKTGHNLL